MLAHRHPRSLRSSIHHLAVPVGREDCQLGCPGVWQKRHALTPNALRGSENTLVRTGARAHQQHSFVRQPQALCKGLGNQGRLVAPALSFALPVERHPARLHRRRAYLRRVVQAPPVALQTKRPKLDLLELQQENRLDERATIDREAAGAIKGMGFVLARGTELRLFFILRQS